MKRIDNPLFSSLLCGAVLFAALFFPALSHAHRVTVFAWVEGTTVYTESQFSRGNPAVNASIFVRDGSGALLLEGKTDADGAFAFTVPKVEDLTVVLDAGSGHRGEWVVRESELREAGGLITKETKMTPPSDDPTPLIGDSPATVSSLDRNALAEIIDEALDRKLKPVTRMLAEAQTDEPSLTEIIGGIGYIFGIMGIILYFKSTQGRRQDD